MNLRTTKMQTVHKNRTYTPVRRRKEKKVGFGFLFKIVMPLAVIFMLAGLMNSFNSEAERLNKREARIKSDLRKYNIRITSLRIKAEQMKGRYVLDRISHFHLKLGYPEPGQFRRVNLYRRSVMPRMRISEREKVLVSQR